ncbi:MAG: nucleotidyltransferase domain-containing protein [Sporichthyaceae bacterium]|nr:nucleotidyltransferase domain-containing protein [Sporichthyaceae bacterium]
MDLASPISSVIPTAHGAVLAVLSRAGDPLSGRQVAALTNGRFGQWRVNEVLGQLADAGIVLRESRPPAKLYRLSREHVAAAGIEALANQRQVFLSRIRSEVAAWAVPADAVWLFGSAARGDGDTTSDVDILLVRPDAIDADDTVWLRQIDDLSDHIAGWSGNRCDVLEVSRAELLSMVARREPLVDDLRAEALTISGASPRLLLRRSRAKESV